MKNRIAETLSLLQKNGEKALVTFITAGDPNLSVTAEMLPLLEKAGADIIELGIPFSDPMADGPTIQRASERALASGVNLKAILQMVASIRHQVSVPIILMGYSNPVYSYGWDAFAVDAAAAGIDGLLLVDLPPEEADELLPALHRSNLDMIFLLTPTSGADRITQVARYGSGFLYYVTVTGVTGARSTVSGSLAQELQAVKQRVKLPIMAGFGISTAQQAAQIAVDADGVVVGSAIVKLFEQYHGSELADAVATLVSSIKHGISKKQRVET